MTETVGQTTESSTVAVEKQTSLKVQNKIFSFIEKSSEFHDKRMEFVELNKKYRSLSKSKKPVEEQKVVEKSYVDASGSTVKVTQNVKRKVFPDQETETLYGDLRKKRKEILRFHKHAILYINLLTEKIIQDFIASCEPLSQSKKTQEKTFGWKQFNKGLFGKTFSYSLIQSSKFFNDFVAVKTLISQLSSEKEIMRLKQNLTKAESTTV